MKHLCKWQVSDALPNYTIAKKDYFHKMNTFLLTVLSFTWGKILSNETFLNRWSKETKGTFLGFAEGRYYGYFIGAIKDNVASVGGDVFAVDKTSIIITNFTHDGTDPGKHKHYNDNHERKNSYCCRNFYLCWNFKSWRVLHQDWISSYKSSGNVSINIHKYQIPSSVCSTSLWPLPLLT